MRWPSSRGTRWPPTSARIDPSDTRVVLVEGGPRVLATLSRAPVGAGARRSSSGWACEVRLGAPVTACDGDGVIAGGERIESRTVIWAAGVIASPAAKWLGAEHDRAGRIMVAPDLSVPGHPDIFAIGDTRAGGRGRPAGARHRARRQADGRLCRPR